MIVFKALVVEYATPTRIAIINSLEQSGYFDDVLGADCADNALKLLAENFKDVFFVIVGLPMVKDVDSLEKMRDATTKNKMAIIRLGDLEDKGFKNDSKEWLHARYEIDALQRAIRELYSDDICINFIDECIKLHEALFRNKRVLILNDNAFDSGLTGAIKKWSLPYLKNRMAREYFRSREEKWDFKYLIKDWISDYFQGLANNPDRISCGF